MAKIPCILNFSALLIFGLMAGCAATSTVPHTTPTTLGTAQPYGADFAARIAATVKKNIVLKEEVPGNPVAAVSVWVGPTGYILGRTIISSSGSAAWDAAVLKALDHTNQLPLDVDGHIPSRFTILFYRRS